MKNIFNYLMLVAVAAMGFACQKSFEQVEAPATVDEVVMTINADVDATRTYIDEANSKVQWSEGDQLKVIENSATYRTTTDIAIDGEGKAKFTVAFPANTTDAEFTYNAIFPASAVVEDDADAINAAKVKVIVKDQQLATATSFDPQADILVANQVVSEAQPTELNMQFKRIVSLGKMTLKNLPADAKISQVVFIAGADDVLAGRNYVNATTGKVSEYGYHGKSNAITVSYSEAIDTRVVYFVCNPFTMEAGETFKVKVECEDKTYTREVVIPEGRSLTFTEGNLGTFSVDMANATSDDVVAFAEGDYAVIAKNGTKYYAMNGVKGSGDFMTYTEVSYDGVATTFATNDNTLVWTISATNGGYTLQNNEGKYLYGNNSGNKAYLGNAQTLTIKPVDGTSQYNVGIKDIPERILAFNTNSGQERFAFYTGSMAKNLYLVPVGEDKTPRFEVGPENLEFDSDGSSIDDDFFTVTSINGFDITTVSATTDADWLGIDDADKAVGIWYMCPAPNSGSKRSADVVFSADGLSSITVTVTQQAAEGVVEDTNITIAEALAVGNGNTIGGTIEGVVVSNMDLNNLTSKKGMYVQDETGALQFYLAANHTFAFGTKVRIDLTDAKLGSYNGAVQVSGVALDKITEVSTGNTVTPKAVTMADFLANKYEGQYIALEGVQVAASDLSNTWVMGGAHTSITMEDANGNSFVVFSSKYASYGAETVAQGAGTLKGISSINNGSMQIIFAQESDYAGLTGERFGDESGEEPEQPGGEEPEQPTGEAWVLVKNVSDLAVDDEVIIVAAKENYALSTTQNTNNRASVGITKSGETVTIDDKVQILTLKAGNKEGSFAFYTGSGYLYAASSSKNYLKTETTLSNNSSWNITISSTGVATIKAQGTSTRNWLRFNTTNNPKIFACYSSGQTDVVIYKKTNN